ncbi:MAG: MerR family DNA-binding transcriptional regulator [Gammaproteobacteria bacterium]|uniref:MerR family transcriptional regulator n=1 Tax=Pseudomaricurvus alcaniphilus TaxID=1166482 RepID=UPI00140D06B6|nr:MerR family DNA-binding transcriptional regulator [Pseudomaricurvus alcaniphilus]MBR9910894.1 MerR family DNA-binding transcriptional regulator [Gammaproteobacteria bacterium]NHN37210.1 MerR family DNA-binding transcriptional regulator [Pseudomaricurvus alcaniphilus]
MSKTFTISELAKEFAVTTRTIRHYEEIGLLSPRRSGQNRIYSAADRTRLKLILRGKRLGFTLEESRAIVEMYDPEHGNVEQLQRLLDRIHAQRAKLKAQLDDIRKLMRDLDEAEQGCLEALDKAKASTD